MNLSPTSEINIAQASLLFFTSVLGFAIRDMPRIWQARLRSTFCLTPEPPKHKQQNSCDAVASTQKPEQVVMRLCSYLAFGSSMRFLKTDSPGSRGNQNTSPRVLNAKPPQPLEACNFIFCSGSGFGLKHKRCTVTYLTCTFTKETRHLKYDCRQCIVSRQFGPSVRQRQAFSIPSAGRAWSRQGKRCKLGQLPCHCCSAFTLTM